MTAAVLARAVRRLSRNPGAWKGAADLWRAAIRPSPWRPPWSVGRRLEQLALSRAPSSREGDEHGPRGHEALDGDVLPELPADVAGRGDPANEKEEEEGGERERFSSLFWTHALVVGAALGDTSLVRTAMCPSLGADPSAWRNLGLRCSVWNDHAALAELFCRDARVDASIPADNPLVLAAGSGNLRIVEAVLAARKSQPRDAAGSIILAHAGNAPAAAAGDRTRTGDVRRAPTARVLSNIGGTVHVDFFAGLGMALLAAAKGNHPSVLSKLIDAGADPSADGSLALRSAARRGNTEAVAVLLARGAREDVMNGHPIGWAVAHGHHGVTLEILKRSPHARGRIAGAHAAPLLREMARKSPHDVLAAGLAALHIAVDTHRRGRAYGHAACLNAAQAAEDVGDAEAAAMCNAEAALF